MTEFTIRLHLLRRLYIGLVCLTLLIRCPSVSGQKTKTQTISIHTHTHTSSCHWNKVNWALVRVTKLYIVFNQVFIDINSFPRIN